MLGTWFWVFLGLAGTGLLGLMVSKPAAKKRVRQWQAQMLRKGWGDTKEAVRAARPVMARSQLRAETRAMRRAQPRRLTFGRRRTPDDPTLARQAAQRARDGAARGVERAKVARANRQAQKRRESRGMVDVLTQSWQAEHARLNGLCGSLDTDTGEPCQNQRGDSDHCHLHTDG